MSVGVLLLLHNYSGFNIGHFVSHWWPLMLIFWGAIKLFERTAAVRSGDAGAAPITAGEILLVLGLLSLLGIVVGVDYGKQHLSGEDWGVGIGDKFGFPVNVEPKNVPSDARITIRNGRGDVTVHSSDEPQIRVSGKKNAKGWNESDAQHLANPVSVEVVQNGDGYEIHPTGIGNRESRISVDLEISVPKKSSVTIRNEKGDVNVSDMATPVTVISGTGDIEIRNTAGDVSIELRKGDIKVSDTDGNVKISGHGGEVSVTMASGGLTLDGEFYGPIRADKVAKGVRFISQRTDLTISQLAGHMEAGSGNLEIFDAPGNLSVRSQDDITIENPGGKLKIDNRKGNVEVRFSVPPKEDIEINNSSAGISLSLPGSASFEILADCHSGDIDSEFSADSLKKTSTESGDSHLEGKYGSGRGPKITLKTSYGSISLRRTSSDMPEPPQHPSPKTLPSPPKPEKH